MKTDIKKCNRKKRMVYGGDMGEGMRQTPDNRGETLVELVVSLALLALLVTMLATAFQASTSSMYDTVSTKREINTQATNLLLEQSVENMEDLTIQYRYAAEGVIHTGSFQAELIKVTNGSLCKFRR